MIIGIGIDLCNVSRIKDILKRSIRERFIKNNFSQEEITEDTNEAVYYAKRFAIKEACAKALGTGFDSNVRPKDIVLFYNTSGAPEIKLFGGASNRLSVIVPNNYRPSIIASITKDKKTVAAAVIIQAIKYDK